MSERIFVDADMLIRNICEHRDNVANKDDWRYRLACDHIIDAVEWAKKSIGSIKVLDDR